MKILLCHRPGGAFAYITDGWKNALEDAGHQVQRWDGNVANWHAFDPDLYVGCSGHRQPIPKERRAKIAIHVNPYGSINIPGIMEPDNAIRWTLEQRPDAVFGYGHETDQPLWAYWQMRHRVAWVPMATAADVTVYHDEGHQRHIDIVYVGGRWGYKAKTIDAYLFPVLSVSLSKDVRGWGDWPSELNVNGIEDNQVNALFNRAKVAPCISEIHTHTHGIDLPERVFKTAAAGCLPIHDNVLNLHRYLPSVPTAGDPDKFKKLIMYYASNDSERTELCKRIKMEVMSAHTYHHRMATLLNAVGLSSREVLEALKRRL